MGLWDFFAGKCAFCKRRVRPLRSYFDDQGKVIKVCSHCSEYAERRAFRKRT
jgi:hypothetical protein